MAELVCSPGTSLVSRAIITRRTLLAVQERHRRRSQVTNLRCSSGGEVPEPLFVNRMVPVGEDGPNRSDQSEGLIERNMVIRLRHNLSQTERDLYRHIPQGKQQQRSFYRCYTALKDFQLLLCDYFCVMVPVKIALGFCLIWSRAVLLTT